MLRVRRRDFGKVTPAIRRNGAGGVLVSANVARVGVQEYRLSDGAIRREYRPPNTVFDAGSLASFATVPVTIDHPATQVDPENWSGLAHGVIIGARQASDDPMWVVADLALTTSAAISGLDAGRLLECSCGYTADLDETPGVTPEGESYDAIQRNVQINHVALGPEGWARAGREARIRIDGENPMLVKFNGTEYDVATPEGLAALQAAIDSAAKPDEKPADATGTPADVKPADEKADAARAVNDARIAALESELEAHKVAAKFAHVLGAVKVDGMNANQIRMAAIKAMGGSIPVNSSAAYVAAYADALASVRNQYQGTTDSTEDANESNPQTIMANHRAALAKLKI